MKSGSLSSSSVDIEGSALETRTCVERRKRIRYRWNGIGSRGRNRRLTSNTLASHMSRLTAATAHINKGTVLNTMTRRATHRADVRLAMMPEANIITSNANRWRYILGQSTLSLSRTVNWEHLAYQDKPGESTNGQRHNHGEKVWLDHQAEGHERRPVDYEHPQEIRGAWYPGNWHHWQEQHHTGRVPGTSPERHH